MEEKETRQTHGVKKIVLAAVIAVALVAVGIFMGMGVQQRKDAVVKRDAEEQAAAYQEELKQLAERIQGYAEDAYDAAVVQASVWRNSIYQERDASTDPYTMEDGTGVGSMLIGMPRRSQSFSSQHRRSISNSIVREQLE